MKSVFDGVKIKQAVSVCELTGTSTPVAAKVKAIDTFGYNSALVNISIGTPYGTTNAIAFTIDAKVQECATESGTYADVSGAAIVQVADTTGTAEAKNAQIRIEGLGTSRMRYLKVVITPAITPATDAKVPVSAVAVLGRAFVEPVGNSATAA